MYVCSFPCLLNTVSHTQPCHCLRLYSTSDLSHMGQTPGTTDHSHSTSGRSDPQSITSDPMSNVTRLFHVPLWIPRQIQPAGLGERQHFSTRSLVQAYILYGLQFLCSDWHEQDRGSPTALRLLCSFMANIPPTLLIAIRRDVLMRTAAAICHD